MENILSGLDNIEIRRKDKSRSQATKDDKGIGDNKMKIKQCSKCKRQQNQGNFCLDCGGKIETKTEIGVQFKPIKTNRTADQLKRDIRNWLSRIGVQNEDIRIFSEDGTQSTVEYHLLGRHYKFSSWLQDSITNNLAAVEQFLHGRVIGIERGIEKVEKAFAGYEALPDYTKSENIDPYQALGFKEKVDLEVARSKFKEMVKLYHPDLNPNKNTHAEFQRIKEAMDKIEGMS